MNKNWLHIAFIYLFIVALLGTGLRFTGIQPLGIDYHNFLHAHSHIAFLGWLFNVFFVILIYAFLTPKQGLKKTYQIQFWIIQLANIGMLISFPIQGYALFSISFSTLHILVSFWFVSSFFKDVNTNKEIISNHAPSLKFIKAAIFFMVLSAIGSFGMGPAIAINGIGSKLYYNTIYFYLHFQYNGWFCFMVLGLFVWLLEKKQISFSEKKIKYFYLLMLITTIPSYLLSILWGKPPVGIYIITIISSVIQLVALAIFLSVIIKVRLLLKENVNKWTYCLLSVSLFSFFIKIMMQLLGSFPYFADLAYRIREFTIGYLHIIFIGFVSIFLFAFLIEMKYLHLKKTVLLGLLFFISGFVISEIIIFTKAIAVWLLVTIVPNYFSFIFYASSLMLAGTALLLNNRIKQKNHSI